MTKTERLEKIRFLQKLEAGLVTIEELKPTSAVIIVQGKIHGDPASNVYHPTGTDLYLNHEQYLVYTEGMRAVCLLPEKQKYIDD
jgi:hypothetical protein